MTTMRSGKGSGAIPNAKISPAGAYFDIPKKPKKQKNNKTGSSYFNKTKT